VDHSRYRKSLAHAFSEKALRDQEPLIGKYVDLLIEKLKERYQQIQPTWPCGTIWRHST
jgi:cytochrome P450